MQNKAYILTIAGFDPSSGAGLTSDIKTFEAHNLYGLSVCTAVTVQNDVAFKDCIWVEEKVILKQVTTLFERFKIDVVKIGIVQSWTVLASIISVLKTCNSEIKIVLDPILQASSGYDFHSDCNTETLLNILEACYFITPNYNEIKAFYPDKSVNETIENIRTKTNIYLKGGHRSEQLGLDEIFYNQTEYLALQADSNNITEKHGSGCVLSASLASNLAKRLQIEDACRATKQYTKQFLMSNTTALGTHNYENV